jgi:hypothetical protein
VRPASPCAGKGVASSQNCKGDVPKSCFLWKCPSSFLYIVRVQWISFEMPSP